MKTLIRQILNGYGRQVTLVRENGARCTVTAFLQPVTAKGWRSMHRVIGALGDTPVGQYLYVGPAEPAPRDGDVLELDGRRYLPRRTELLCLGSEPLYAWGLLTECGGDTWTN